MNQRLQIKDYEVSVYLGCDEQERKYLQQVRFNFDINYKNEVIGAKTDILADATDYVGLTEIIKTEAKKKKYQLVEHLAFEAFKALSTYLKSKGVSGRIELSVQKLKVPVENLKNGVVFTCSADL